MRSRKAFVVNLIWLLPLGGCQGVLNPQGQVGAAEKLILLNSLSIMLVAVVPVIFAIVGIAWWFRAGNKNATYRPNWSFSGHLELLVWAIPTLVITFLGGIAWFGSHALDPYTPLSSEAKPIEIEVISLDWKWLFIYPDEEVATINHLFIPVKTPIHFRLTSSGVMNSFFVPQLGSQIYTMAGMASQLSLQADSTGIYPGLSAQFSGEGFSDMNFTVSAVSTDEYAKWLTGLKADGATLDRATYAVLAEPSKDNTPKTYKAVERRLFDTVLKITVPASPNVNHHAGG